MDLGVNNLGVAFEGAKVSGTRFIPGRQHELRRFRKLKAIVVRKTKTGSRPKRRSNHTIWPHLRHRKDAAAQQAAR